MFTQFAFDLFTLIWYNVLSFACFQKSFAYQGTHKELWYCTTLHGIVCMTCSFCTIIRMSDIDNVCLDHVCFAWSRYLEWIICCPLLISQICIIGDFPIHTLLEVTTFTTGFCMSALIAVYSNILFGKILMVMQGIFYYILLIVIVFSNLFKTWYTLNHVYKRAIKTNMTTILVIWPLYVMLWVLGNDIFNVISKESEHNAELVLSIIVKTVGATYVFQRPS